MGELFTQETKTTQCWPKGLKLFPLQLGYTLESLKCRREHMGSFESVLRSLNVQPHWTTHSSYRARIIPDGRGGVPEKSAIRGKTWLKDRQGRGRQPRLQRLEGQIHLELWGSLGYQVQLCALDLVGSQAQEGPVSVSLPHHASLHKALSSRLFV